MGEAFEKLLQDPQPAPDLPQPEPIERQRLPTVLRDAARLIERELERDTRRDSSGEWAIVTPECTIHVRGSTEPRATIVAINPAEMADA